MSSPILVVDTPGYPGTMRAPPPRLPKGSCGARPNNPTDHLIRSILLCLAALGLSAHAGEMPLTKAQPTTAAPPGIVIQGVKTTAYTHSEADHLAYGARTAAGTKLLHGQVRSAAADWSVYPVGTVFQIQGDPSFYIVDDYGSALVGTRTIDLYKPTTSSMKQWGTRQVTIRILKWGSFSRSLAILRPRANKASHVREMVTRLAARAAA
jgi:3D (Asp-Asp-Asp) domain-containing protein